ncbi:MAG TPA: hypothetical protein VFT22_02505 [Kofleriaceae bacterium]|nr:hypothetical protein [Kofleriaceae bacterium]
MHRRTAVYGGDAVRREETERAAEQQRKVAALRARLIAGPTLPLPARALQVNFNPNELVPLGDAGTAYPTLRASAAWGELVVDSGGALLDPGWSRVIVSAPQPPTAAPALPGAPATTVQGDGW